MKRIRMLFLALAALFILSSCSGTEVSAEEFKQEASQVETKTYNSAVVTYKATAKSGDVNVVSDWSYTFTNENNAWSTTDKGANVQQALAFLEANVSNYDIADESTPMDDFSQYGEYNITYYVKPFSMKLSVNFDYNGTIQSSATSIKGKMEIKVKFNDGGCLTEMAGSGDLKVSMNSGNVNGSYNIGYSINLNITYK